MIQVRRSWGKPTTGDRLMLAALASISLRLDAPLPPAASRVRRLFGHGLHRMRRLRLVVLLSYCGRRFEFPFRLAGVGYPLLGLGGRRRRRLVLRCSF